MTITEIQKIPKAELQILLDREISKRSLYEFFLLCMKNIYAHILFDDNWHYKVLCDILQERTEAMLNRSPEKHLLVNLPIRAGKTILISEIFPVWLWIKSEKLMIQNVCATQRLATKSSRMSKLILTSNWFKQRFPEIVLSQDNKSKSDYSTTTNGHRASYGIDSSIIGSSYDVLIVDDPNDPTDTNSDTALKNVVETFKDVISGRMNNEWGMRVILQQRTSSKDLCQHLLDNNRESYRHVCIPAELTKDCSPEFRQYYQDGLFFPKRYGRQRLATYAMELTSQAYASQLLQSPSALAGEILLRKWFNVIKQSDFQSLSKAKVYMFLDTAYTSNDKNDPTGFYICTVIGGKIYIMYAVEKWLEFYELLEEIKELIKVWGIQRLYIEQKANGINITQELKRTLRGKVMILGINPGSKSKQERARAIQDYLVNGRVVLVQDIWNEAFMTQIAGFPYQKNDSHVDNLVYSILTLIAGKFTKTEDTPTDTRGEFHSERDFEDLYT